MNRYNLAERISTGQRAAVTIMLVLVIPVSQLDAQVDSPRPADKVQEEAASSDGAAQDEVQKPGPPDYTTLTGFIANAELPTEEPTVYWKLVSEIDVRSIEAPDRPLEMIDLTDSVVGDGVVYVASRAAPGKVFALRATDGSQVWRYDHSAAGISTAPSIDEDHVYFESESGVTAIRRENGEPAWHHDIEHGTGEGSPIPVGDRVYVSGYDGVAYALNQADGSVIWTRDFARDAPTDRPDFPGERARFQEIVARPRGAACDGRLFVQSVFDQSRVIAIDCKTGNLRWSFQSGGWIEAPTIAGNRVYVGSQDKFLYCLDGDTGDVVWKFLAPTWLASRVAVHDGIVFLPVHGGRLYQLDAETGQLICVFQPEGEGDRKGHVYSFPIITGRTAYFASGEGQFYAVDIQTNVLKWKLRPSEGSQLYTSPTTDGRMIFVTCRQNFDKGGECALIAIGPKP